jgi:tripartite-type tricarboxylate transporter receptor subunit TctC
MTMNFLRAIAGMTLSLSGIACAQPAYPSKPIRLIVPFAAGGPVDFVARLLSPKLTEAFRQSVVVDNRGGASGLIGIETAIRAQPDGYTMIIVSSTYAGTAALVKLPYDPVRDVTPISLLGESPSLVTLHPSLPAGNVRELIAYEQANSGKLSYGSSGTGGSIHLATELFNQMAGTRMLHVPYKGQGPALNDVLGGQIQFLMASPLVLIPHVKTNRLRAIAVTTPQRVSAMPEVPAIAETVPGYQSVSWQAVLGPKGLPRDVAARWNHEIDTALQLPDVKARLTADGMQLVGGSPARVMEVLARDVAKWQRVVKTAGIKL